MATINETGLKAFTAGEALEAYRRVKLNSSGQVVYADAFDASIGITDDKVASGDTVTVRLHGVPGTRKMVCAAAVTAGAFVYADVDGKVNDAYVGTGLMEGIALDAGSGDGSIIEVLPKKGGSELLHNATAQSDALGTSSAAEATFSNGSVTIPAGEIKEGDVFRVKARGTLPATNSTDTFTGKLKVGTEVIVTTPLPDAVNGDQFIIDAEIAVRVAGSSGKLVATGYALNDALAAGLAVPFGLAEASEDISGAIAISVTGQFSASSAGNEARLQQFSVERVRK